MNKKINFKYWSPFALVVLAAFVLVYICALMVPFHSDDYSYFLQGLSVKNRIEHYFNWSGRLITDFTSSYLLNLFSHPIYMAINTLVLIVVLVAISILPWVVLQRPVERSALVLSFAVTFMAYWVGNPSLGQTSFWIVGSANYIWPLMWASFYMLYLFHLLGSTRQYGIFAFIGLAALGFLTGLSNEATGISILFLSFVLLLTHRHKWAFVLTGLLSTLSGFLILYLAPGNYVRLTHYAESKWSALGFFERIFAHVVKRMPTAFTRYWFALLILILLAVLLRRYKSKVQNLWDHPEVRYGCAFICLSVFSVLVFLPSPAMPARAMNTALYFSLIAIAFFSTFILSTLKQYRTRGYVYIALLCGLLFVPSYVLFYQSVANASIQHEIRESIIAQAKEDNQNRVDIPDWYFTRLLKKRDAIDEHRNKRMANYYGMEKINWTPAYFNYAILQTKEPLATDIKLDKDLQLRTLYEYREFAASKDGLVLGFNHKLAQIAKKNKMQFSAELQFKERKKNKVIPLNVEEETKIGDFYYYWIPLKKQKLKDIQHIVMRADLLQNEQAHSNVGDTSFAVQVWTAPDDT